jgi:hypothetical protein
MTSGPGSEPGCGFPDAQIAQGLPPGLGQIAPAHPDMTPSSVLGTDGISLDSLPEAQFAGLEAPQELVGLLPSITARI